MSNKMITSNYNTITRKFLSTLITLFLIALFYLVGDSKMPDYLALIFIFAMFLMFAICILDIFFCLISSLNISSKNTRLVKFFSIDISEHPFIDFSVGIFDLLYARIGSIKAKYLPKINIPEKSITVMSSAREEFVRDKTSIIDKHQNRIITIAILMACFGVFYHFVIAPQVKVWNYRSCKESAEKNYTNELFKACEKLNIRYYCDNDSVERNDQRAIIHRQLMQAYYKIEQCKTEAGID